MSPWFDDLTKISVPLTALATLLTVVGAVVPAVSRLIFLSRTRQKIVLKGVLDGGEVQSPKPSATEIAKKQVVLRIDQARELMDAQKGSARALKWSANSLAFGQYVIGGVLASSFIQHALDPNGVGLFGVLVLIASLVKQQFHPEISAEHANRKAAQLEALIWHAEDEIVIISSKSTAGEDRSDAMISLLKEITEKLTEIQRPQTETTAPHSRQNLKSV